MTDTPPNPAPAADAPGVEHIPLWRLWLALAFVPGMYLVLLGGAAFMLLVAGTFCWVICGLLLQAMERTSATFGSVNPELFGLVIMVLLIYATVQSALLLLSAVRQSIARNTMFEPAVVLAMLPDSPLTQLIDELCRDMGTRRPDYVMLHALPEIYAVQARVVGINGRARGRVLMLSAPQLRILKRDELRSVIAHELAHFTGRDTTYSRFVVPVYRGTEAAIEAIGDLLTNSDQVSWSLRFCLLPLVRCLRLYRAVFHRANMDLQRAREFRADHMAARITGREPLQRALLRIACHGALFYERLPHYLKKQREPGGEIRNIYSHFQDLADYASADLAYYAREVLEQDDEPELSHPAVSLRLAAIADMPPGTPDPQPARELVPRIDVLEKQLTASMRPVLNRMMIVNHTPDRRIRLEDLQLA